MSKPVLVLIALVLMLPGASALPFVDEVEETIGKLASGDDICVGDRSLTCRDVCSTPILRFKACSPWPQRDDFVP